MASTDAKSGFRLPWSTDRNDDQDTSADESAVDPTQAQDADQAESTAVTGPATPAADSTADTVAAADAAASPSEAPASAAVTPAPSPSRKTNKFMADLTKAMQTAAEAARADSLERFSADAKAHIEGIHTSTADEATDLRKKADEDVSKIREWSKAEIARIREETDERIAHRKEVLEREIEAHAAQIEARIERVQSRVTSFEAEMAAFFERLLAEEDPTRFAAMAETMPEPPAFDTDEVATASWSPAESPATSTAAIDEAAAPVLDPWLTEPQAVAEPVAEGTEPVAETIDAVEPEAGSVADPSAWEASAEAPTVQEPVDDEATGGSPAVDAWATQPAAAQADELATDTPADNGDLFGIAADEPTAESDPRLSALGIAQDFATAEAEAADFTAEAPAEDPEIPTIAEDALAARLAGLVAEEPAPPSDVASTRVIVTGLVSVASIAGFKRNLARVSGVRTVGVSSGPDGEFVFAVSHDAGLDLTDGIATLPGFGARVTNEAPGELTVAARDPESEG
ncbi:MAG TPA: hypothetical protein VK867_07330 [Candidatus Limnocylindrales bacterium]|nr:hypothetical protein [Candidatus Limnocylindrales bacterium]